MQEISSMDTSTNPHEKEISVDPIMEYCRTRQFMFPNFHKEVFEVLPEFCRVVKHFSCDSGSIVREMLNSRSPLEIEVLNGLNGDDLKVLSAFFGPPTKPAGHVMNYELANDPVIRLLGGAYEEQTVYIREIERGLKFYAAVWPWRTRPGMITLHFGAYDSQGGARTNEMFKNFLHEIPA
jgi:hypothetical protein